MVDNDREFERSFIRTIKEWREHCLRPEVRESKRYGHDCIQCGAYKKLLEMDKTRLFPLCLRLYNSGYLALLGITEDSVLFSMRDLGLMILAHDSGGLNLEDIPTDAIKEKKIGEFIRSWLETKKYLDSTSS